MHSHSSSSPALRPASSPAPIPTPTPAAPAADLANPFPDDPPTDSHHAPAAELPSEQLTAPLPDLPWLEVEREKALALGEPGRVLRWIRSLVRYLERDLDGSRRANPRMEHLITDAAIWVRTLVPRPSFLHWLGMLG